MPLGADKAVFVDTHNVVRAFEGLLLYTINTSESHSGSPVVIGAADGSARAIGVHVAHGGALPAGVADVPVNVGAHIDDERFDFIEHWARQHG